MQTRDILGVGAAVLAALSLPAAAHEAQKSVRLLAYDAGGLGGVDRGLGLRRLGDGGADPALRGAVAEINAGRAQVYRDAAAKSGATPEAAGASAFVNAIQPRLKPGHYYRPNGGGWTRK